MNYPLLYLGCVLAILLTLYFSSKEDLKYHRISKKYVIIIFIIVLIYNTIDGPSVDKTFAFMLTVGVFGALSLISRGQFGIGDTLILGALGWFIGNMDHLRYYFIVLVFCILILGTYFVLINYKKNGKKIKKMFKITSTIPITEVEPGMVLADDYFMKGLKEEEIEDLKNKGITKLTVKQTYPFIPVIFISFLLYVIIIVSI